MSSLTRIVPWSQTFATDVLRPGDLAVDLTVGKGRDTLALAAGVGAEGRVVGFDLQAEALDQAEKRLVENGWLVQRSPLDGPIELAAGVTLVEGCHSRLNQLVGNTPKVIMANLGYLPGGDPAVVTRAETTRDALVHGLELLQVGGRLVVTAYPGHPGGAAEGRTVEAVFSQLSREMWQVLKMQVFNRPEAPYLLVAERSG